MQVKIVEQRVLTADEGMTLTNGETFGKTVVLPTSANADNWHEITDEEASRLQAEAEERGESDVH